MTSSTDGSHVELATVAALPQEAQLPTVPGVPRVDGSSIDLRRHLRHEGLKRLGIDTDRGRRRRGGWLERDDLQQVLAPEAAFLLGGGQLDGLGRQDALQLSMCVGNLLGAHRGLDGAGDERGARRASGQGLRDLGARGLLVELEARLGRREVDLAVRAQAELRVANGLVGLGGDATDQRVELRAVGFLHDGDDGAAAQQVERLRGCAVATDRIRAIGELVGLDLDAQVARAGGPFAVAERQLEGLIEDGRGAGRKTRPRFFERQAADGNVEDGDAGHDATRGGVLKADDRSRRRTRATPTSAMPSANSTRAWAGAARVTRIRAAP